MIQRRGEIGVDSEEVRAEIMKNKGGEKYQEEATSNVGLERKYRIRLKKREGNSPSRVSNVPIVEAWTAWQRRGKGLIPMEILTFADQKHGEPLRRTKTNGGGGSIPLNGFVFFGGGVVLGQQKKKKKKSFFLFFCLVFWVFFFVGFFFFDFF